MSLGFLFSTQWTWSHTELWREIWILSIESIVLLEHSPHVYTHLCTVQQTFEGIDNREGGYIHGCSFATFSMCYFRLACWNGWYSVPSRETAFMGLNRLDPKEKIMRFKIYATSLVAWIQTWFLNTCGQQWCLQVTGHQTTRFFLHHFLDFSTTVTIIITYRFKVMFSHCVCYKKYLNSILVCHFAQFLENLTLWSLTGTSWFNYKKMGKQSRTWNPSKD